MVSKKNVNPLVVLFREEWKVLGSLKKYFFLHLFLAVLSNIMYLIIPFVVGMVFNNIQGEISSFNELYSLMIMISFLLALRILFWIFHASGRIIEMNTGFHVKRNYVNDKMDKVLRLPIKWHKDHHSGDTIDKINKGSTAIGSFASFQTFKVVSGVMSFFGSFTILFFIDSKIATFAFVYSLISIYIITTVDKRLSKYYKDINKKENKLSAAIFDYLSNIVSVVTLRLRKVVLREVDERKMESWLLYKKSTYINEFKWGFVSIGIQFMVVCALLYRSYTEFSLTGTILVGTLYMLYRYLENVGQTFFTFADLYGKMIKFSADIDNVSPIEEAYKIRHIDEGGNLATDWKEVKLSNISFSYEENGDRINVDRVTLKFKRGQKIALVGESGSGKSTILSLIRGLYPLDSGSVYVDNLKMEDGFESVKNHVTLIPQEPEIFNNTFRYNVTMGLSKSSRDVDNVISIAQLKSVISELPSGLSTSILEKGVSLSGGEKQRLALARGLLFAKDSDILLMDEPTSSVDSINEIKIHNNVFREFNDKTIISSIHRLHLLDMFDYIYLFNKGKIVGEGTFEEIRKNHRFDKVWRKYHQEKMADQRLIKKVWEKKK